MAENINELNLLLMGSLCLLLKKKKMKKTRKQKRYGIHPTFMVRKTQGFYENLLQEARLSDPLIFFNFTRLTPTSFDNLLAIVGPSLSKTSAREPISPGCRLAVTLRFLATRDSYPSLSYAFRIGVSTVCNIIRETCDVLWKELQPMILPVQSLDDLQQIAVDFFKKLSLPNCIGAIDGKHIVIQAPYNSGSLYFNYKKNFSMVLLAVCDANYLFTYVDIGGYGSQSDGGVLHQSAFRKKLFNKELDIPQPQELPFSIDKMKVPHYFVGDEAFPLREKMRPFSKPRVGTLREEERIFNYRLSRAIRVIENTFGIMVARFRILYRVINAHPTTIDKIIKSIVCLHNFIRRENNHFYMQENYVDKEVNGVIIPGVWRADVPNEGFAFGNVSVRLGSRNASCSALTIRNTLKEYVNGPGACLAPWQWNIIDKTK